ncbi:hypothetical protein D3C80_2194690 [compost metagenome]
MSNLCVRSSAKAIRPRAVARFVASSSRRIIREPSPSASLKALAAGVTSSLMANICPFQRCMSASLVCLTPMC